MKKVKQVSKKYKGKINLNYLLYLPDNFEFRGGKLPFMLFLHGAGERGKNLEVIKKYGPPALVEKGEKFAFILVSPQCPEDIWWSADFLYPFLNQMISDFNADADRIYLTGLSMGGFGTWELAQRYPEKFTAIAPVCGGGNPKEACKVKDMPMWIFHGAKDKIVPVKRSLEMIEALKNCGADPLVTIYPDKEHDSWTETYNNLELYKWFLKQKKNKS